MRSPKKNLAASVTARLLNQSRTSLTFIIWQKLFSSTEQLWWKLSKELSPDDKRRSLRLSR